MTDNVEEKLVNSYSTLLSLARRYTQNSTDAEDLAQDTAVRVLRYKDTYIAENGNFRNWLITVLKSQFLDNERRKHRRKFLPLHENHPSLVCKPNQQERLECEDVLKAINSLPKKSREITIRTLILGISEKETALALGIKIQTVRSTICRSRKILKDKMVP